MRNSKSKVPERYDASKWSEGFHAGIERGSGQFSLALVGVEASGQFAAMVSEFTHLEIWMERVLERLMRTDRMTASHVMRSIISATARIELMRALLTRARHNVDKPVAFDEIINEFAEINALRNQYVHARWQTDDVTGQLYINPIKKDPLLLDSFGYEEFDIGEFDKLRNRISKLMTKLMRSVVLDIEKDPPQESP